MKQIFYFLITLSLLFFSCHSSYTMDPEGTVSYTVADLVRALYNGNTELVKQIIETISPVKTDPSTGKSALDIVCDTENGLSQELRELVFNAISTQLEKAACKARVKHSQQFYQTQQAAGQDVSPKINSGPISDITILFEEALDQLEGLEFLN